ncbi:hypothetical protein [Lacisediminihabitans changchengi]|uniref:Alkaline shock response membrane anchor protein AmaP n=1 Tax=Lacisediminihabitans changchengi TaxID=2787634 RepID=A0A934SUB6_9MICO|nr:hypothetical protein [Lacisediminihabitans changchengi]MBK4348209.1 hypothetical protein [Lacisediminihabitans changchengi]
MTRSNRILNRVILAVLGLVLIAAAAYVAGGSGLGLPNIPKPSVGVLWAIVGGAVVVIVLSLIWILSRGRGRIRHLIEAESADGSVTIDALLVADLVGDALADQPDVVAVSSTGFRMRRRSVLSLRVTARRGADLARVIRAVDTAVEQLDGVLEQQLPVLLHVTGAVRATRQVR